MCQNWGRLESGETTLRSSASILLSPLSMFRFSIVLAAIILSVSAAQADDDVESPLVTVIVHNVRAFVTQLESRSNEIKSDEAISTSTYISRLGEIVGDPRLSGIAPGATAVAQIWPAGEVRASVEVASDEADTYAAVLSKIGYHTSVTSGVLVVASSAEILTSSPQATIARNDALTSSSVPAVSLKINISDVLVHYGPTLDGIVKTLSKTAVAERYAITDTSAASQRVKQVLEQMSEVWFRCYLATLKKLDTVVIVLTLPKQGIRTDWIFRTKKPTTHLSGTAGADDLLAEVPALAAIRSKFAYEPEELRSFILYLVKDVSASMAVEPDKAAGWARLINGWFDVATGEGAFSLMENGQPGFNASYAVKVTDPALCMKMLQEFPAFIEEAGITELYSRAGVKLTTRYEENTGSYKSIPIHSMTYKLELSSIEQLPMGAMGLTDLSADIVIFGDTLFVAMGSADIKALIDRAINAGNQSTVDLHASTMFEPGARYLMDYDIVNTYLGMGKILPPTASNRFGTLASADSPTATVSIAGYSDDNGYRVSALIPTSLIRALKQSPDDTENSPKADSPATSTSYTDRSRN